MSDPNSSHEQDNAARRIAEVLKDVAHRRAAGEDIAADAIVADHADLMPELGQQLAELARVEQAKEVANAADPLSNATVTRDPLPDIPRGIQNPADTSAASTYPLSKARRPRMPRIEGYEIQGVLGQGGMGIVYRAVQENLNRTVALKVLPAIVGDASSSAVARFRREAKSAARLHHTNIVPVYDFGEATDGYYYAMELVRGQPLDKLIRRLEQESAASASNLKVAQLIVTLTQVEDVEAESRGDSGSRSDDAGSAVLASSANRGRPYFQYVATWMAHVADALHYAHGQGIVHRDIKPANLILATDGRIMVADFGLAKSEGDQTVTATGALLGTVRYLSPEQAMARRLVVDHRTDIYSLGATLYELLCFTPAFPGSDEKQVLSAIITRDPTSPRKVLPSVPVELETICFKSLEKSPDARYQTAADLASDLRRYLQDLPITARRPNLAKRARKFVRRRRALVIATAAIALSVVTAWYASVQWRARKQAQRSEIQAIESASLAQRRATAAEAERLAERGAGLAQLGRWHEARRDLDAALDIDPENVIALQHLAWLLAESTKDILDESAPPIMQELEEVCRKGLQGNPKNAALLNYLGYSLKRQDRFHDAIVAYQACAEADPTAFACLDNAGKLFAIEGHIPKSKDYLERAVKAAGRTETKWHAHPWRNLAMVELFQGEDVALQHVEIAIQCHRADAAAWLIKSRILLALSGHADAQRALNCANTADNLAATTGRSVKRWTQRMLALCYLRLGRYEQAERHSREAVALGDMPCYNRLIQSFAKAKLGEFETAIALRDQAIRAWPDKLAGEQDILVSDVKAVLWIDSAAELRALEQKVADALAQTE